MKDNVKAFHDNSLGVSIASGVMSALLAVGYVSFYANETASAARGSYSSYSSYSNLSSSYVLPDYTVANAFLALAVAAGAIFSIALIAVVASNLVMAFQRDQEGADEENWG